MMAIAFVIFSFVAMFNLQQIYSFTLKETTRKIRK